MARRRDISEQTKELFGQFGKTMGQRLKKAEAVTMLRDKFSLTEPEALVVFHFFDQDSNDELSMWEYQHFVDKMGDRARPMLDLFKQLEKPDGNGTLDLEKAFDTLKALPREDGAAPMTEDKLAMTLQMYAGPEKCIDLTKYINLMCSMGLKLEQGEATK
ncbi:uncharacterized protein LOC143290132 [Babylonia areolata]|uniref:uncharacterized protein LOC143290132 n=1 Tax=Babylonia areolata TaxID=304850 RepID=UPI003FD5BF92